MSKLEKPYQYSLIFGSIKAKMKSLCSFELEKMPKMDLQIEMSCHDEGGLFSGERTLEALPYWRTVASAAVGRIQC
jgi:hypothetical protein